MKILISVSSKYYLSLLEKSRDQFASPKDSLRFIVGPTGLEDMKDKIISKVLPDKVDFGALIHSPVVALLLNFDPELIRNLRRHLPFLFVRGLTATINNDRRSRNILIGRVKLEMSHIRRFVDALNRELREHDSTTPFLLPLENFHNSHFREFIVNIQDFVSSESDYYEGLHKTIKDFQAKYIKTVHSIKRTTFVDSRSVVFQGPAKARGRHGEPSGIPPHNIVCLLNGIYRVGAPYDVRFHYDCEFEHGGGISGVFRNCHQASETISRRTHLNIAPNDALR